MKKFNLISVIVIFSSVIILFEGCFSQKEDSYLELTCEVPMAEIIKSLSNYSRDTTFNLALAMASQKQRESQRNFIEFFGESFEELAPNARLADIFVAKELRDQISFMSTNSDVLHVIDSVSSIEIDNIYYIIRNRIKHYGFKRAKIQQEEVKGRFSIKLPGIKKSDEVLWLFQSTGLLEFWETYENPEVIGYLVEANNLLDSLKEDIETLDIAEQDDKKATEEVVSGEEWNTRNPLFALLSPAVTRDGQPLPGSVIGYSHLSDTAQVMDYLNMEQIRSLFPRDIRFYWNAFPMSGVESDGIYELHAIKITTRDNRPPLYGDVITSAGVSYEREGLSPVVDMSMNTEGSHVWARLTGSNIGRCIAIVLDGYVISAPTVSTDIKGGSSEITGDFTNEEAEVLAYILKSGSMSVPLRIVEVKEVMSKSE